MTQAQITGTQATGSSDLARYYLIRGFVAAGWVAAAVAVGRSNTVLAAVLLVTIRLGMRWRTGSMPKAAAA